MLARNFSKVITFGFLLILCVEIESGNTKHELLSQKSCYQCMGDECTSPETKTCGAVAMNDQCFMEYNENGTLVELGCKSKYNSSEVNSLVRQKKLWLCDEDNCNHRGNIPQPHRCLECDSISNELCATRPEFLGALSSHIVAPYTQCYVRITGSVTKRGYIYHLKGNSFLECLSGNSDNCKICDGESCNNDIFPINRRRCHICNSQTDNACENTPSALTVCPSYNKTDLCVATFEHGITKRGCQTDFTCNYESKTCQLCRGDGCNSGNIKRRFDDVYGIFQDLPLNCYTCKGDDCDAGKPVNPNKCEGDEYQDCLTVFDTKGKVVQRGCEHIVLTEQQSYCSSNPHLCFKCKANGCNNMTDASIYQECLYCDAATNPDCLFKPNAITTTRKCALGCVSSLYPRKTDNKVQDFVRTCFEDIEPDNRESCTEENNCIKCLDNRCNSATFPAEYRLSCLHCNGFDCNNPFSKQCLGYMSNDMCYIYFDNVTLTAESMGCRSDISDERMRKEIKQLFVCDGNNCNNYDNLPPSLSCIACDSENDINCALNIPKVISKQQCDQLPYTQCYSRIRDGFTVRGCVSDLPTDTFISCNDGHPSSLCEVCADHDCNKYVFPSRRQKCHRCNSTTDSNCEAAPNAKQVCPVYHADDACITQWINGTTLRACASEVTCDGLSSKKCRSCSGYNCNKINLANQDIGELGLFTSLPLSCYQCNGTAECKYNKKSHQICGDNIYQPCTTSFNGKGEVIARGCADNLEGTCSVGGNTCLDCKSNNCNSANQTSQYIDCLFCRSEDNEDCVFNVTAITRTRKCYMKCMTALYPRTRDKNPVYEIVRTCLDDKDLKDHENCDSTKDHKCISCGNVNCNTDTLGTRKSCYQCTGDKCKSPETKTCRAVAMNDQCFMEYNENGTLVELGCKSKYNSSEVNSLVRLKKLWLCDEDNCNHMGNIPQPHRCLECDSISNELCATRPEFLGALSSHIVAPYTQCYVRITGSVTKRGYIYHLKGNSFLECLSGNSDNCKICDGESCNNDIFPINRRRCHICNSQTDNTCENTPSALTVCPSYNKTDLCVATFEHGITKRGCQTDFTCNYESKTCQLCRRDGCNSGNIRRRFDDVYGIFQDLPLNCYTCKGDDCDAGKPVNPNKCEGDEYQDCLTVFDTKGKVVQRGCEHKVLTEQQSYCSSNPHLCFKCKANGCNNMTDASIYQECLYCDAATNPDCLFKPNAITTTRKCALGCVSSLYPRKTDNKVQDFVRTCFEDIEPDNRESCTEENNCIKCLDNRCNSATFPAEYRLSCLHCNGFDCNNPFSKQCLGYMSNDMCYIYFDNVTLTAESMGCRSDISDERMRKEIKQLFVCDGNNCNNYDNLPPSLSCIACDSENDINCALNIPKVISKQQCDQLPYTQCYSRIRDGFTVRGCVSDLPTDTFISCNDGHPSSLCEVCADHDCNKYVFPSRRQKCHRCNSTTDSNCEAAPNAEQVCPVYHADDACITQWINGTTLRACASEVTCDGLSSKKCRSCSGYNCNKINLANQDIGELGLFTSLPLSCYQCNGTAECKYNKKTHQICGDNIYQPCTTSFNGKGEVIARGCADNLEGTCSVGGNTCLDCKSNNCNSANQTSQYIDCLFCRSEDNEDCVFNVTAITRTRKCYMKCMTALYPRTRDKNPVYEIVRTCLDDKDLKDHENCDSTKDHKCISCGNVNCNTDTLGTRKSCYQCTGDKCKSPETKTCRAVAMNDQCFMEYNENGTLVELGCKSKYNSSEVNSLVRLKKLWLCDEDNCNHMGNIPQPHRCLECDSISNELCATRPEFLGALSSHIVAPYTQCYVRITGSVTKRGYIYHLKGNSFLECLSGNSDNCKICDGESCNNDIFPINRRRCHICNSQTDNTCENTPSALTVCPSYNKTDLCVATFEHGITKRGCQTDFTCNYESKTCQLCRGDGCNSGNIKRRFDDVYGIFQDLPLNCYTCKGDDCDAGKPVNPNKCEGDEYQDCLTVFDTKGKVVQRGCEHKILTEQQSYCSSNPHLCFKCKANGCNNMTDASIYQECLYCDAATNPDCLFKPNAITTTRKCALGCVSSLYPRKTDNKVQDFVRTCFEDIEPDNRESCTEENNCIKCLDNRCNSATFPAEYRLSCLHCNGFDCNNPFSKQCLGYMSNDMCYIYFDNVTLTAESMGCRSDISDERMRKEIKQLFVCDGNNCNNYDNLPPSLSCIACDSENDINCALNIPKVISKQQCDQLPYTQCYSRIRDGFTVRGCVSDLPTDTFISCNDGHPSSLCKVCAEHDCNKYVFPSRRQKCHRCNSTTDSNCEAAPNAEQVCPVYHADDACITQWINGTTLRACASEVTCDGLSSKKCRSCSGYNCNKINLANQDIGELGLFTSLPLSCYQCNGTRDCRDTHALVTCKDNIDQACTTSFNKKGEVIARGCYDNLEQVCSSENNICNECKSNGCNIGNSTKEYTHCIHCDSKYNEDCVLKVNSVNRTRKCYHDCMTALYPRTNDSNPVYELIRTCLDDKNLDDRISCNNTDFKCQSCAGKLCNTHILGSRMSCYQCKGDKCLSPESRTCRAVAHGDQCFIEFDERANVIEMGCRSKYNPSEVDTLLKQKRLWLCNTDNCNSIASLPKPQLCLICNSRTDENCAIKPNVVNTSTMCDILPYTQCYIRVLDIGYTERGCLSNLKDDEFLNCFENKNSSKCMACIGNNCNRNIFPTGRGSCQRCNSKDVAECENSPNFASICPIYSENEYCATKLANGHTYRGCSSELQCDDSDKQYCRLCYNSNDCNTVNLAVSFVGEPGRWQELPLRCHHCEGKTCRSGNTTSEICAGNNLQTCMTVFDAEGIVVQRGCSDNITLFSEYCDKNIDKCLACKSNDCNNAERLNDYINCYFCDSSENSSCGKELNSFNSKTRKCQKSCMVGLYREVSGATEISRTCLDDLESFERSECAKSNSTFCKACDSPLCNTMNIPSDNIECYKCIDDDCEDMAPQKCMSLGPSEECYVLYNKESSVVSMGCSEELDLTVIFELKKQKLLRLCKGTKCNAPENLPTPTLCSACSSAINPFCATNPNLVNNVTHCAKLPYTDCFTRMTRDGYTERGCLETLQEDDFSNCTSSSNSLCKTCASDRCNAIDAFPENSRCFQCDSASDPNCESLPSNSTVCELYNDSCLTKYRNGITTRGCASSFHCDNKNDPLFCRKCEGNNCNTINLKTVLESGYPGRWQKTPIACYVCEGEKQCAYNNATHSCYGDHLQNCMTAFSSTSGKVLRRGCSDMVDKDTRVYCDQNPGKCLHCNSNKCNKATSLDQYVECSYCDSEVNDNCISNAAGISVTRQCYEYCMTALYPRFEENSASYGLLRSCYDDMEDPDRKLCVAGNNTYCNVCDTPRCNLVNMPKKRLSCFTCEKDECSDPSPKICSTYRPDDKCYTRFDENGEVTSLGCHSQFSNTEAERLLRQKLLFTCNGENCNTLDNIPKAQTCVLCSSRTTEYCAVNIIAVGSSTKCGSQPYTHCYSRVLADGTTERGCLSNLYDDEFLDCLNGTSATCKSCIGNKCNNEIYPANRLKCHICNSNDDGYNCEDRVNKLRICPNYDPDDTCVTAFRNNVTYRGCSSNLGCDIKNPLACIKCSGEGCNTINLASKQDYNFGMWQDLPLTCLSCSGNDCNSKATTKSLVCQINNKEDCMTVFNDSGAVIARGCSDSIESKFCLTSDANCYRCKSNKCNNATSNSDFAECVYCNSYNSQDCIWNPLSEAHKRRKCNGGCMTALYPAHGSNSSTLDLIRSCLDDKELSDQQKCSMGKDKTCSACSGSKCNINHMPKNRLSCFACEGELCVAPEPKLCPLYRENDQCFIRFGDTNSISEMGCISSFRHQDLDSIIKTKRVQVCLGSNCNNVSQVSELYICTKCSSTDNISCAADPSAVGTFNACTMLPFTSCYTKLTQQGETQRGCLTDLSEDYFANCVLGNDNNCSICNGNGCNQNIFPPNRLQCYTCRTSEEDRSCEFFPTTKKACPIVSNTESCVTAVSGNITVRGCKSLIDCDLNDSATCRSCFSSECNSIDLLSKQDDEYHGMWQELPLKCYTCEADHCLYSLGQSVTCSTRNIKQDCMTVFDEQGIVERRGCSDDIEDYRDLYCRIYPGRCFKCKSNECNIAWSLEEYVDCLFCDSAKQPLCALKPDYSGFESRKCYKNCMVAMRSEKIMRSCLDDKEMWAQSQCQLNKTNDCSACSGDSCNNFAHPHDRLKCHVCTSSTCSNSVSEYCEKYDINDFCFAKYENGSVNLMGCISSQNASLIEDWTTQNKLFKCDSNDCNDLRTLPKTVCLSCDSIQDPNCAQNPSKVSTIETCVAPTEKCFTGVDNQGHTIRGCSTKLNATDEFCESSGTCSSCQGEKCNNQIYPVNRLKCYICNSSLHENCKQSPSTLKVCLTYDAKDKCVSALDSNGLLKRDCLSQVQCSTNTSDFCNICDTIGCNIVELTGSGSVATNSIFLTLLLALCLHLILKGF